MVKCIAIQLTWLPCLPAVRFLQCIVKMWKCLDYFAWKGYPCAKGAGSGAGGIRTSDTCSGGLTLALSLCISAIISIALLVASPLVDIMASSRLLAVSTSANMSILDASALALSSGTPLLTSSAMYALLIASRFSGVGSSLLLSLSCALTIILPEQLLLLCSLTTILILHYLLLLDL